VIPLLENLVIEPTKQSELKHFTMRESVMRPAKRVLLVTNTATEREINQVKEALAASTKGPFELQLSLVHVIPSLPTCYFNIPSTVILAEQYYEEAQKCLLSIGEVLNVSKKDQWLITGRMRTEVPRLANKLGVNFILASSTNLAELHAVLNQKNHCNATLIQNINNLGLIERVQ